MTETDDEKIYTLPEALLLISDNYIPLGKSPEDFLALSFRLRSIEMEIESCGIVERAPIEMVQLPNPWMRFYFREEGGKKYQVKNKEVPAHIIEFLALEWLGGTETDWNNEEREVRVLYQGYFNHDGLKNLCVGDQGELFHPSIDCHRLIWKEIKKLELKMFEENPDNYKFGDHYTIETKL